MKKIILRGQNSFIGKNCKLILRKKFKIVKFSKNQKVQRRCSLIKDQKLRYSIGLYALTS